MKYITDENKKKIKKNKKIIYYASAIVLFCVILIFALALIFTPDKAFSEKENRTLAQKPELSLTALKDGSFMDDLESYIADQFSLRDSWISLKLSIDMLLGKKEVNGVYIGKDNQLIEIPDEPDYEKIDKNLEAIKGFAERHEDLNVVMTLVPNACLILSDKLPVDAPVHDQNEDIDHVMAYLGDALSFVDLREVLSSHADEYIYYKTDHHWTSLATGYAFDELKDALAGSDVDEGQEQQLLTTVGDKSALSDGDGVESQEQQQQSGLTNKKSTLQNARFEDYVKYTVTEDFSGTLASKCGYMKVKDTIDIYTTKKETDYIVDYVEEGIKSTSIYDSSKLETQNKYEVFFGGNYSKIVIETTNDTDRSLLILKDSYANCFVQFLLPYYKDIVIIDPRYYCDDIEMVIRSEKITDVLILYNVNTFNGDRFIADILE